MMKEIPRKPRWIKYKIILTEEERADLQRITTVGRSAARKIIHAQILLCSDESTGVKPYSNNEIADLLSITERHVINVRKRFVEEGLESAINRKCHSRTKPRIIDGEAEAHLIAIACDTPPKGRSRWTLKLLSNKLVELEVVDSVSASTVGRTLKKTNLSRG